MEIEAVANQGQGNPWHFLLSRCGPAGPLVGSVASGVTMRWQKRPSPIVIGEAVVPRPVQCQVKHCFSPSAARLAHDTRFGPYGRSHAAQPLPGHLARSAGRQCREKALPGPQLLVMRRTSAVHDFTASSAASRGWPEQVRPWHRGNDRAANPLFQRPCERVHSNADL